MSDKFQNKYRIASARASWWDYGANGFYFITICTAGRECCLGRIVVETHGCASPDIDCASPDIGRTSHNKIQLSEMGKIVHDEWLKSFEIRSELYCHSFVIMPNHIHAIVQIEKPPVETHGHASDETKMHKNNSETQNDNSETHGRASLRGIAKRTPKSISSFVAGFKSASTKRINKLRQTPRIPAWQTRFHDHIIRNGEEYQNISNYIRTNPINWERDMFYNNVIE